MRLFIAARASVAREIALALLSIKQIPKHEQGYFVAGDDVVTWCGGHLLELADPETYDDKYKHWRLEDLPIIPANDVWKLKTRLQGKEQLEIIRRFLLAANEVVHAGDPDREGQWIIDEVLQYLDNQLPVKRLLIQDLNVHSIRKALTSLRDNKEFIHLSESAKARSRADWLYGINMTRAYTLLGRHSGYEGVLSIGRVQTPVLALVVKRDELIEQFKPIHYFEATAKIVNASGDSYCYAKKKNQSNNQMLLTYDECVDLAKKIDKKSGKVCAATESQIIEPPPLAFNLSALQIESSKQFGLSAKEVQDISWQLYEKYHLITYPRTDNRYLPETEFDNSGSVLDAVILTLESESELIEKIRKSDCWIKKSVWDNKKITLHHGIIPSTKHVNPELLTEQERQVYKLIASYYVAQFYPDYEAIHRRVNFVINAEMWSTSGQKIVQTGWHDVLDVELQEDDMNMDIFADWHEDETIYCEDLAIRERQTRPPARFTDATLMEAMANISAHTEHAETKTLLKNGDGLGTETTRAFIIESLFNRGFLMKGNKTIFSTAIARDLVHALPSQYDLIDIAALWERNITSIADQNLAYKKFMLDFEKQLQDLIAFVREKKNMTVRSADEVLGISAPEKYHCLKCQSMLVLRSGKRGDFWGCSRYPECKFTVPDRVDSEGDHHPDFVALDGGIKINKSQKKINEKRLDKNCPDCGKVLVKRKGKRGVFAGCSGFPACKHTEPLLSNKENID